MEIFELISVDKRGAIIEASVSKIRTFVSTADLNEKFLVFEHTSPDGPNGDRIILIPEGEMVSA